MASKFQSKTTTLRVLALLLLFYGAFSLNAHAQGFDFFYLVQQWAGAYCSAPKGCCYPPMGTLAPDFSINGLWPAYNNGSLPSYCDPASPFDPWLISDLEAESSSKWPSLACPNNGRSFWKYEWESVDIMGALEIAGIRPNNGLYTLSSIEDAVKSNIGYTPGFECNTNIYGNKLLYRVYLCADPWGSKLIDCPVLLESNCSSTTANSKIHFPSFLWSGAYTL